MELRAEEGFAQAAGWNDEAETTWPGAFPEEVEPSRSVWPFVAAAALAVWIAFAGWIAWSRLGDLDAVQLLQLVPALCAVPILVATVWLLLQRNSRAEARRFGGTARAMREEAARLERTVSGLSHAVDANRVRLSEQVSALMAMGDAAHARLGGIERDVGAEIARIDAHARGLAEAGATALESVEALLAALPRTQAGVEDAARLLDRAGASAADHTAKLDARVTALADRGREADSLARGAAENLARHLAGMEEQSGTASARLEAVSADLARTVDALVARTTATVDGARQGIAAQGEAMIATVAAHQSRLDGAARDSADALADRIAGVEAVIERVADRLEMQRASGDLIVDRLQTGIAGVEGQLERLHEQGSERAQTLAASISALGGSADAMTEALRAGDAMATHTIGTTESLLIALDAAAREIDETLPEALTRLDARIAGSKRVIGETKPELLALVTAAESTHDAVEAIAGVIADQRRTLDQLSEQLLGTLSTGRAKADALGHTVDEAIDRTRRFADEAAPQLVQALARIRDTAAQTADDARDKLAAIVPEAVSRLEAAGTQALRRAASGTVERQVEALALAADAAVEAASHAAERVARECRAIADQTAIVEARIEQARDEREKGGRDTLSRRVAGLIEALNSASIDVAKLLRPEVSDSAWAAYLKGDRGVFTRRAVRLLDGGDARDIARLYDADEHFRESVNRYIHDFEAMLRGVLQQADGSPLGITLLSSDMGKLYVALAQAIERLR
ncbi:hypothetical protein [uncultured Sphingomonas sp.]|uniref:hypothetical protein n=1 Tax=uncultured Sphingomonas sp. TaxID=158754 RepID=UPI0035CBA513